MDSESKFMKIVYEFKRENGRGPTFSELIKEGEKYALNKKGAHLAYDKLDDLCLIKSVYIKEDKLHIPTIELEPEAELFASKL